jgi:sulfite reductase (NADPH) flavoprotein alpha-component
MTISESNIPNIVTTYSKQDPFHAKISKKEILTKDGSSKHTYHIEIDISNSGITYKPGDSIGIFPENDPILVDHLLQALNARGDEIVIDSRTGKNYSVKDFLRFKANLSRLTSSFLKIIFQNEKQSGNKDKLNYLLQKENKEHLMTFLSENDPLDVLKEFRCTELPLQDICNQFGPLLPRFYSISSSQRSHPDHIHLTVALYTFTHSGEQRFGVASHFLCNLAHQEQTLIPLYVHPSHNFFLPDDPNASIIMVGPGTGVAPFRAFLQERIASGASGKNWLFFGERNKDSDYFYGEYFEALAASDQLKVSLAFSRDQEEKVYVQHKMLENGPELWRWLQDGAYFFICGDAQKMAKDVEQTLLQIAMKEGLLSEEEARGYLKTLKADKRYRADVY